MHFPPVRALMENAAGRTLVHGTELVSALRDAALLLDPSVASLLDTFGISIAALRRLNRALEGHAAFLAQQARATVMASQKKRKRCVCSPDDPDDPMSKTKLVCPKRS